MAMRDQIQLVLPGKIYIVSNNINVVSLSMVMCMIFPDSHFNLNNIH